MEKVDLEEFLLTIKRLKTIAIHNGMYEVAANLKKAEIEAKNKINSLWVDRILEEINNAR